MMNRKMNVLEGVIAALKTLTIYSQVFKKNVSMFALCFMIMRKMIYNVAPTILNNFICKFCQANLSEYKILTERKHLIGSMLENSF